jgi:hypothetical protein
MKLYAISDTYQQAIGRALETEEDAEALTRELSTIMDSFAVKAEAVLGYVRNVEADANAYKAEADRMATHFKALQSKIDRLKEYLAHEMRRCNLTELHAGPNELKFVKNPWSVELDLPADELPEKYRRVKVEADKAALATDLKTGIEVCGARLVQTERLRIT